MHLLEGRLDVSQLDPLGDKLLEREAALLIQRHEGREVSGGRQSPYQLLLSEPPRPKISISGSSSFRSGVGTPTRTTVPARSRAKKACW